MGLVYAKIELLNSGDLEMVERGMMTEKEVRKTAVKAMVDSGAYMLAINQTICHQLGLRTVGSRLAELADGTTVALDLVGPIEVRFENRSSVTRVMVLPGDAEVLLGAIPMEEMDVIIDPLHQRLLVHPERPYIPKLSLK